MEKKPIGLVLEGGGAKGAFQIGAVRALDELGYEFTHIVGTSIGAINGAAIASGKLDELERVWRESEVDDFIAGDPEILTKLLEGDFSLEVLDFLIGTVQSKGLDTSPLRSRLESMVDENAIRSGSIEFGLTTLAVTDMVPRGVQLFIDEIPSGRLIDYIMASSSLPGFRPLEIDGSRMIDGGLYDNLPINMLLDKKCRHIVAIRVHGVGFIKKITDGAEERVTYILPSDDLGGILEISKDRIRRNIDLGYLDTMKAFGRLRGTRYYLTETFGAAFEHMPLPPMALQVLSELLSIRSDSSEEAVVRAISNLMGEEHSDKTTMFTLLIERLAETVGVERIRIYRIRELIDTLTHHFRVAQPRDFSATSAGWTDFFKSPILVSLMPAQEKKHLLVKIFCVLVDVYDQYKGDYYETI